MKFACPECNHGLRSLCARLDGNPIWRCYGCGAAFIYRNDSWYQIPAPPVKPKAAPPATSPVRVDRVRPAAKTRSA